MFYHLTAALAGSWSSVAHYASFRVIMGFLSTLAMTLAFGPRYIDFSRKTFQNSARPFTPQSHQSKGSTPTMGGLFILAVTLFNMMLWCDWSKPELWIFAVT